MTELAVSKPIAELSDEELARTKKENKARLTSDRQALEAHFGHVISASDLLARDFPEPEFIVPGLIPVGFTLLAGAPKIGKSWFALQLAVALSTGGRMFGELKIEPRPVLYIALEDTLRRLNSRLKKMGSPHSENLFITNRWEQGKKGIDLLRYFKVLRPELQVVIIDTLQAFRGRPDGDGYAVDYSDMQAIRDAGNELGVSIIVLHHKRKAESETDPFDEILGSQGVCGVVDTALLLKRDRRKREAVLHMTSRDLEEAEIVLQFDGALGTWSILGDADVVRLSRERQEILEAADDEEFSPAGLAKLLGKNVSTVNHLCIRLEKEGYLRKVRYGVYQKA